MNRGLHKNKGFTLIEILVALLILTIGLLGIGGLQTKAQQYGRYSYLSTQATVFGHDILERARANPKGLLSGFYNKPNNQQHASCYSLTGCSVQEMAENDMYEWHTKITSTLPGGGSVICLDSTPNDGTPAETACDGLGLIYAAKVWWKLPDGTDQRVVITTAL